MSWILAIVGFALLIILHELGHFVVAKRVGMRVERFVLFFPPILAKKKIGETEYGIGSIPLGGYVKITGMSPEEKVPEEYAHRSYVRQPVWKRVAVIGAGPLVNIVLAFVIFWIYFAAVGQPFLTQNVSTVVPKSPAASVLKPGDHLVSVDGVRGAPAKLSEQIHTHKCAGTPKEGCKAATPAHLVIKRNGKTLTLTAFPVYETSQPAGMRLGFRYAQGNKTVSPVTALDTSVTQMWRFTSETVGGLARIFDSKQRKQITGIVGAYDATEQSFASSFSTAIFLLGIISLSLGIINLLPILPLDGGHIFWALVEKIRRRPVPIAVLERASIVGFVLVIALFAVGLSNDIGRLTTPGFISF